MPRSFDAVLFDLGGVVLSEYFSSLRSSLGIDLSDAQLVDGWSAIYVGEVAGVPGLLSSLEDGVPLYARRDRASDGDLSA